ncbi:PKD domain-containing protein, partial [Undibacterium arcticum]
MKHGRTITAGQQGSAWSQISRIGILGMLNLGLAACGGSGEATIDAAPAVSSETAVQTNAVIAVQSSAISASNYRVINLAPDGSSGPHGINVRGQVAFTDGTRALFYDGHAVRDLGNLGGGFASAIALNSTGQVAGVATTASGNPHAFRWSRAGGLLDLGTLGGAESYAAAINEAGQIAGRATDADNQTRAFFWSPRGGTQNLGSLGGYSSRAVAINAAGRVAGNSIIADNNHQHAFNWSRTKGMQDLGPLGTFNNLYATGINDLGQVIGAATDGPGPGATRQHPYVWSAGAGMVDLGTFGGDWGNPYAINDAGQIAGYATTAGGDGHAFVWRPGRGLRDLGTLGGTFSLAGALNNLGQAVGYASTASGTTHAFVWSAATGMVDLNSRIPGAPAGLELQAARAISDSGAIVADSNAGLVLLLPGASDSGSGETEAASPAAPAVGPIIAPEMIALGAPLTLAAGFTDATAAGAHRASWSWDDGSPAEAAPLTERRGAGNLIGQINGQIAGTHRYQAPGVYAVTLTVSGSGGASTVVRRDVVVV